MYKPVFENWFYSYVEINNLKAIQEELTRLHLSENDRWKTNDYYTNISAKIALEKCVALREYLTECKILDKFDRLLFSSKQTTAKFVHIDSYNPAYCQTSLNIPLIDCENSYTAFYKSRIEPRQSTNEANFAWLHDYECEEINRVEVIRPMLVNTTILHRGIAPVESRLICGIRFSSPLTHEDALNLKITNPFFQEHQ